MSFFDEEILRSTSIQTSASSSRSLFASVDLNADHKLSSCTFLFYVGNGMESLAVER